MDGGTLSGKNARPIALKAAQYTEYLSWMCLVNFHFDFSILLAIRRRSYSSGWARRTAQKKYVQRGAELLCMLDRLQGAKRARPMEIKGIESRKNSNSNSLCGRNEKLLSRS